VADLVGEEPVAELGIVAVRVVDGVGQVRLVELGVGDRRGEPAVVRLTDNVEVMGLEPTTSTLRT
jgi:hypothetical protein